MSYDAEAHEAARRAQQCVAAGLIEHVRLMLVSEGLPSEWRAMRMRDLLAEYDEHERTMRATLGVKP